MYKGKVKGNDRFCKVVELRVQCCGKDSLEFI